MPNDSMAIMQVACQVNIRYIVTQVSASQWKNLSSNYLKTVRRSKKTKKQKQVSQVHHISADTNMMVFLAKPFGELTKWECQSQSWLTGNRSFLYSRSDQSLLHWIFCWSSVHEIDYISLHSDQLWQYASPDIWHILLSSLHSHLLWQYALPDTFFLACFKIHFTCSSILLN